MISRNYEKKIRKIIYDSHEHNYSKDTSQYQAEMNGTFQINVKFPLIKKKLREHFKQTLTSCTRVRNILKKHSFTSNTEH